MAAKKRREKESGEKAQSSSLLQGQTAWYQRPIVWFSILIIGSLVALLVVDWDALAQGPEAKKLGYELVKTYPHDASAWTQGLVLHEGRLFESTGQYGRSTLREVELETGNVLKRVPLSDELFGEGLCRWNDQWRMLTWREEVMLTFDAESLALVESKPWPHEGWGLAQDGTHLIISDGTDRIFFVDPTTMKEVRHIDVTRRGRSLSRLNELEYINGKIYANVWYETYIAIIDPETGIVTGEIDLAKLRSDARVSSRDGVLNGIAYDPSDQTLLVTGKLWPKLYRIRVVE